MKILYVLGFSLGNAVMTGSVSYSLLVPEPEKPAAVIRQEWTESYRRSIEALNKNLFQSTAKDAFLEEMLLSEHERLNSHLKKDAELPEVIAYNRALNETVGATLASVAAAETVFFGSVLLGCLALYRKNS